MAGEQIFFARQLEHIRSELYRRKYKPLKSRAHFPVDIEITGGEGVQTITHRMIDGFGRAAIGLGYPRVDVRMREFSTPVRNLTDSYGFDQTEIWNAMTAGIDLNTFKAMAAQDAIMQLADRLAYTGDSETGLIGAFSHPNVPILIADVRVDESSTPTQIINLYNKTINYVEIASDGSHKADTVLHSTKAHTYIATTPRSDTTDTTILQFLQASHPGVFFDSSPRCTGAGIGGTDVLFAYNRDPVAISLNIPLDFTQLPEYWTGKGVEMNCIMRFGGIEYRYVAAVLTIGV